MNAKNDLNAEIARLIAMRDASEKLKELVGPELERLRELDAKVIGIKNASGEMGAQQTGIWDTVFTIASKVWAATLETPETREQMFTDALGEFLNPPIAAGADKVKITTAGQYASTARKLIVNTTKANGDLEEYAGKSVKDVRQSFKAADMLARMAVVSDISKELRYIGKYGTDGDLQAIAEAVRVLYNPIKEKRDAKMKKNEAAKAIPELQQQQPAEPAQAEQVAGVLAEGLAQPEQEDEDQPQQAAQA